MKFLGCLGLVLFGIFVMIYGALRNIYNAAFGSSDGRRRGGASGFSSAGGASEEFVGDEKRRRQQNGERVFPDNVGEYVDYEEVK
ncbi:MAG: DUF4834 family protein [Bacteroidaceae bacterium]|nr:DUF4834 family protein [Bacteroidaceae bacterium]